MNDKALDRIIESAASSVEIEGATIDRQSKIWCKLLINNKITIAQYIELIKAKAGVI